jgi:hypothetical protein
MEAEGGEVSGGAVAFVGVELVGRIAAGEGVEEAITFDLGEDGGGGDGAGKGIALDDGVLREGGGDADGIDEEGVGWGVEGVDGAKHGEAAGLEDINAGDFGDAGEADGPGEGFGLDAGGKTKALWGGNGFGIAETGDGAIGREDDGGGGDRTKETAPAGFIDAGRSKKTESPQAGFVVKSTSQERLSRKLDAFLEAGGLAFETAEVVEFGAAHAAGADDLDLIDDGGVDGEDTLDAGAESHLTDDDIFTEAGVFAGDEDALESLGTFLVAFLNLDVDTEGVTDAEVGVIGAFVFVIDLG